ncbi:hypothetical protein SNEBB_000564 [Seison nebaliae]|nr:hypothetical protein SNEBB_000564 [Seison nebaliae]
MGEMDDLSAKIDQIVGCHAPIMDYYFSEIDTLRQGFLNAFDVSNFLKRSKLPNDTLREIWDLADSSGKGYLDRLSFYILCKYVALAQHSLMLNKENLLKDIQQPSIGDVPLTVPIFEECCDWYIFPSLRIRCDDMFDRLMPINGKLLGDKVKPLLMKSSLPLQLLGRIWELSDIDTDGSLTRDEFSIAVFLVEKAKRNIKIPDSLPQCLLPPQQRRLSLNHGVMPEFIPGSAKLLNNRKLSLDSKSSSVDWVVTSEEKLKCDKIFAQLDLDRDGFISGIECKDILMNTKASKLQLATIWSLCDWNSIGKLSAEQFALAIHMARKCVVEDWEIPEELPQEMIPPSKRNTNQIDQHSILVNHQKSHELIDLENSVISLKQEKSSLESEVNDQTGKLGKIRTEHIQIEDALERSLRSLHDTEDEKTNSSTKIDETHQKKIYLGKCCDENEGEMEKIHKEIEMLKKELEELMLSDQKKQKELATIKVRMQEERQQQLQLSQTIKRKSGIHSQLSQQQTDLECQTSKTADGIQTMISLKKELKEIGDCYNEIESFIKETKEEKLKDNKNLYNSLKDLKRLDENVQNSHRRLIELKGFDERMIDMNFLVGMKIFPSSPSLSFDYIRHQQQQQSKEITRIMKEEEDRIENKKQPPTRPPNPRSTTPAPERPPPVAVAPVTNFLNNPIENEIKPTEILFDPFLNLNTDPLTTHRTNERNKVVNDPFTIIDVEDESTRRKENKIQTDSISPFDVKGVTEKKVEERNNLVEFDPFANGSNCNGSKENKVEEESDNPFRVESNSNGIDKKLMVSDFHNAFMPTNDGATCSAPNIDPFQSQTTSTSTSNNIEKTNNDLFDWQIVNETNGDDRSAAFDMR